MAEHAKEKAAALEAQLQASREAGIALEARISTLESTLSDDWATHQELLSSHGQVLGELEQLRGRFAELEARAQREREAASKEQAQLQGQLQTSEERRRQTHNRLQELRGNIRVMVRVRPFIAFDGYTLNGHDPPPKSAVEVGPDGASVIITNRNPPGLRHGTTLSGATPVGSTSSRESSPNPGSASPPRSSKSGRLSPAAGEDEARGSGGGDGVIAERHRFEFDRSFGPDQGQEEVFQEVGRA